MADPYETGFRNSAGDGPIITSRQELITYEWRGSNLYKIVTKRKFYGDDYQDEQTSEVLYIE